MGRTQRWQQNIDINGKVNDSHNWQSKSMNYLMFHFMKLTVCELVANDCLWIWYVHLPWWVTVRVDSLFEFLLPGRPWANITPTIKPESRSISRHGRRKRASKIWGSLDVWFLGHVGGQTDRPIAVVLSPSRDRVINRHAACLVHVIFTCAFANRAVDFWNNLPNDVIPAVSVYPFECRLNSIKFAC